MIWCYKKINKLWRVLATGLCFSSFGLGGMLLASFIFPLIRLIYKNSSKRKQIFRLIISGSFRFFMNYMHYLGLIRFSKVDVDKLKQDKSCILIANHPTLIDVVSIIAYLPNACCIVKKDLWDNFFVRGVVEAAGYIPNENPDKLLADCELALKNGDVLVIFPEGTRTTAGEDLKFQRGAAHAALMLGVPIRCIEISCEPITLTKGLPWYKVPKLRPLFTLKVLRKFNPYDYVTKETPRPKAARQLNRIMLEHYCHLTK